MKVIYKTNSIDKSITLSFLLSTKVYVGRHDTGHYLTYVLDWNKFKCISFHQSITEDVWNNVAVKVKSIWLRQAIKATFNSIKTEDQRNLPHL
jgi:hypothetical protein